MLQGYRLWGVSSGIATFQVTIRLYRGSSMIAEKTGFYNTRATDRTFEVHFSQQISIRAGRRICTIIIMHVSMLSPRGGGDPGHKWGI